MNRIATCLLMLSLAASAFGQAPGQLQIPSGPAAPAVPGAPGAPAIPGVPVVTYTKPLYVEWGLVVILMGTALFVVCRSSRRN